MNDKDSMFEHSIKLESVGYENIKIYDFRKEKTYFSVIIELTK